MINTKRFTTEDGQFHMIDRAGNYFIGKVCVNPTIHDMLLGDDGVFREAEIGYNHPPEEARLPIKIRIVETR